MGLRSPPSALHTISRACSRQIFNPKIPAKRSMFFAFNTGKVISYTSKCTITPASPTRIITRLNSGISSTVFASPLASPLLSGLDLYEVNADDNHPLSVYGIHSNNVKEAHHDSPEAQPMTRKTILLLHGRTWSSVPVFHLLGGKKDVSHESRRESRSLMEMLYKLGLQPYCMDFRGFGGTPSDATGIVEPNRCVGDVECVLNFIAERHRLPKEKEMSGNSERGQKVTSDSHMHQPVLLGWSQGALIAQLTAQKSADMISKLVLYGSIFDPLVRYPRSPLYINDSIANTKIKNTFNEAIEDFTVKGSIAPESATIFAEAALLTDPIKVRWKHLCQLNNLDPARIHNPTLVIGGDQDPYAPLRAQADLFSNIGRGVDRTWSVIADADHAVHLLDDGRGRFSDIVKSFVNVL